jgi:hypothetical protein
MIRTNYKIGLVIIIILLSIPLTSALQSVNISGYITSHQQTGTWFKVPNDISYNGFELYYDNIFISNKSNTTIFYNAEFLTYGNHTLSTMSFDLNGSINGTWYNVTMFVDSGCHEDWFCADYCGVFPNPERKPINSENISQGQLPTQSAKQYSDISLWYLMLIITIGCLIASRNVDIRTLRPIIFATISFISSITLTYISLSIAVIGNFTKGMYIDYINQTNSATFYYQVIQVEAAPWITALCISITVLVIINGVDIILRYIEKSREIETLQQEKWRI